MRHAREYHVERYLRECLISRSAPVSAHRVRNFLAERVLGLAKSW
jgi:acyl-CoA dehydrogenase